MAPRAVREQNCPADFIAASGFCGSNIKPVIPIKRSASRNPLPPLAGEGRMGATHVY